MSDQRRGNVIAMYDQARQYYGNTTIGGQEPLFNQFSQYMNQSTMLAGVAATLNAESKAKFGNTLRTSTL
jgi:hypothetical protein